MSKRLNSTAGLKLNVRFWHKADIHFFLGGENHITACNPYHRLI